MKHVIIQRDTDNNVFAREDSACHVSLLCGLLLQHDTRGIPHVDIQRERLAAISRLLRANGSQVTTVSHE